jgi:hypothetical protein
VVSEIKRPLSPQQPAVWRTPELRVEKWDSSEVVRGNAGIHACLMPRDWRRANIAHHPELFHYTRERYTNRGDQG